MESNINILIIEDELIIAEHIKTLLEKQSYKNIKIAVNYKEAIAELQQRNTHLVITDIMLGDGPDGIEIGEVLKDQFKIPFIYLTSLHSKPVIKRASHTRPNAYLVKPFKAADLYVAVELAVNTATSVDDQRKTDGHALIVKDGYTTLRIPCEDIIMLKAEENYCALYTNNQRPRMIRRFLGDFEKELPQDQFIRIHRSYIVNANFVSEVRSNLLMINKFQIPISRTYSANVKAFFNEMDTD